jgi:heme oxygenase (biliverdin-IX-beta and delta-forming)
MRVHMLIKQSTSVRHAKVDELFSAFNLTERESYVGFLRAHAQALIPLEMILSGDFGLPRWVPRGPTLLNDLEALKSSGDIKFRGQMCSGLSHQGSRFGVLYVLEGSRFGAAVLKGRLASRLPCDFLSAKADSGQWPNLLSAIECAAAEPIWLDHFLLGARVAFDLFAAAAIAELRLLVQPTRAVDIKATMRASNCVGIT